MKTLMIGASACSLMMSLTAMALPPCGAEQTQKLTAADGQAGDRFGRTLATDGVTLLVGAHRAAGLTSVRSGRVAVYESASSYSGFDQESWNEVGELRPPQDHKGQFFGTALAVDGGWAAVGAFRDGIDCGGRASCGTGAVYLYQRGDSNTGAFEFAQRIVPADAHSGDRFGLSMALAGNTLLIGATGTDDACSSDANCNSGAVYVYELDHGAWYFVEKIVPDDAVSGMNFGWRIAIDGERALISAGEVDGNRRGAAYFYERQVTGAGFVQWNVEAKVRAIDTTVGDRFGRSVALDGDFAVIGAYRDDTWCPGDPDCDAGMAHVYRRIEDSDVVWEHVTELMPLNPESGDLFGHEVELRNGVAVVTATRDDDGCSGDAGCDSGAAYIFTAASGWGQVAQLTANDADAGDKLGRDVVMTDDAIIVGAARDDEVGVDGGAAYIFTLTDDCPCTADLDGDADVDFQDLILLLDVWGSCETCGRDLDGNGVVDFDDRMILIDQWGPCAAAE